MTIDNSSTLKSTKSSRELHLELERRGSEGVSPVTGDEVQDCPLLLSGVTRLELVEGAQVEHGRLLQQQHRLLGQPENGADVSVPQFSITSICICMEVS